MENEQEPRTHKPQEESWGAFEHTAVIGQHTVAVKRNHAVETQAALTSLFLTAPSRRIR